MPNFNKINPSNFINKIKIDKFIFTKRQWFQVLGAMILVGLITGGITWGIIDSQQKKGEARRAENAVLFADFDGDLYFDFRFILIPDSMTAKRKSEPSFYREERRRWGEDQIRGRHGDGEWTKPSEISSEIFKQKNDAFMDTFFGDVE